MDWHAGGPKARVAAVRGATILCLHSIAAKIKNICMCLCMRVYAWLYGGMKCSSFISMCVCGNANTHFHFKIKFCFHFSCFFKRLLAQANHCKRYKSDTQIYERIARHSSAWMAKCICMLSKMQKDRHIHTDTHTHTRLASANIFTYASVQMYPCTFQIHLIATLGPPNARHPHFSRRHFQQFRL